ncbi:MAG: MFS transporter [Rothia sp. (in: high G+C Gram-positive bacteria)]|nr:MFS transporter [Rothia sp. (in: high G+C Gram-positive bacteria)]
MLSWVKKLSIDPSLLRVNPAFRSLFWGRLISIFVLSMLTVSINVQVYQLTGSSLQVALVNTVLGVSSVFGSLVGGVLADRYDRRSLILITRSATLACFVGLALNAGANGISLAWIYGLCALNAAFGSASAAAFGAAIPSVVPASQLPAAASLMALALDLGVVFAPALAGYIIAFFSLAAVFWILVLLSALSLLVLAGLPRLVPQQLQTGNRDTAAAPTQPKLALRALKSTAAELAQSLAFTRANRVVAAILFLGLIQILCASPHVLIPELVNQHFGGSSDQVGLMYSAPALGALVAGLMSGWVSSYPHLGFLVGLLFICSACGILLLGLASNLLFALAIMVLVGALDVMTEIVRFTIISEQTPDRLRGKITSLWQIQLTVGDALGGPALSLLAKLVGAAPAIALGGALAALLSAGCLLTNKELRNYTYPASKTQLEEK